MSGREGRESCKKPFMTVRGEWNNVMMAKPAYGDEYLFIDVKAQPEMKKECVPVMQQGERESRRLWRHVTAALLRNRINVATTAKRLIEQRQRAEAKQRLEKGERWKTRYFSLTSNNTWVFNDPLEMRL
uniref:PH domain-containing protein n=1 Tax=Angiostrongylus cantonensis TaxID=6313 RepID=A0A0K0D6W0_ANGCA